MSAVPTSVERTWRRTVDHVCRNTGGRWNWPKTNLAERDFADGLPGFGDVLTGAGE